MSMTVDYKFIVDSQYKFIYEEHKFIYLRNIHIIEGKLELMEKTMCF